MSRLHTNTGPEPPRDENGQPTLFRPGSASLLDARDSADSMTRGNSRSRSGRPPGPRPGIFQPVAAPGQPRPVRGSVTGPPHLALRPGSALSSSSSTIPSAPSPEVANVAAAWNAVGHQRPPPPENVRITSATAPVSVTVPAPTAPIQAPAQASTTSPHTGPRINPMQGELDDWKRRVAAFKQSQVQAATDSAAALDRQRAEQEKAETKRREQETELARKRQEEQEAAARQEKARQEREAEEKRIAAAAEKKKAELALKKKQEEEAAELVRKQTQAKKEQEAATARQEQERRVAMQKAKAAEDARKKEEDEQRAAAQQLQANRAADTQTLRDALMRTSDDYAARARADSPMQGLAVESTVQLSGATARIHMAPLTPVSRGSPMSSPPPRPSTYDEARRQRRRLREARANIDNDIVMAETRLQELEAQRKQLDKDLELVLADLDRLDIEE